MACVLNIAIAGNNHWTDPDEIRPVCDFRIIRDGEDEITDSYTPVIAAKTLGIYKTATQCNTAAINAVKAYIETAYEITTFDHVFLIGGYGTISL